jgi:hypothetical protein
MAFFAYGSMEVDVSCLRFWPLAARNASKKKVVRAAAGEKASGAASNHADCVSRVI